MPILEMREAAFVRDARVLLRPISVAIEVGCSAEIGFENARAAAIAARLAAGIVKCTSGSVYVGDFDPVIQPVHVKKLVGLVPYAPPRSPFSDGAYIAYRAALWGLETGPAQARGAALLSILDGLDRAEKLALAGALLHRPQLLILERPGEGLKVAAQAMLEGASMFVTYGPSDRAVVGPYADPSTAVSQQ